VILKDLAPSTEQRLPPELAIGEFGREVLRWLAAAFLLANGMTGTLTVRTILLHRRPAYVARPTMAVIADRFAAGIQGHGGGILNAARIAAWEWCRYRSPAGVMKRGLAELVSAAAAQPGTFSTEWTRAIAAADMVFLVG